MTRGALHAKVTCWLRFDPAEIDTTREVFRLAERNDSVPDVPEVKLTWTYPDPGHKSDYGFTQCDPPTGWRLLKTRVQIARLLATGRVGWDWFHRAGGVFTFDQERTGLGKTISRQVWNIIHGTAEACPGEVAASHDGSPHDPDRTGGPSPGPPCRWRASAPRSV